MSGFFVLVGVGAIVGGLAWLVIRGRQLEKKADFERRVRARKQAWHYDGTRDGRIDYRFSGERAGIAWTMWYDSDRGDDSPSPKAFWTTENLRADRLALVIIGRKRFGLESGAVGRLLMGVVSGVAQAVTGGDGVPDKAEFYESAVVLEEGRPAFRQRFAVAQAPDMPRGWVDEILQQQLLEWPDGAGRRLKGEDSVEVNLGPRGLSITVQQLPADMAHWEHLASLGEHLAARLAGARH